MPPSTDHPVNPPTAISGGGPGQTIIELKKAFLTTQIRLLTAPLQPPPTDWQERLPEPEEGDLRDGVIRDVLHKGLFFSLLFILFFTLTGFECYDFGLGFAVFYVMISYLYYWSDLNSMWFVMKRLLIRCHKFSCCFFIRTDWEFICLSSWGFSSISQQSMSSYGIIPVQRIRLRLHEISPSRSMQCTGLVESRGMEKKRKMILSFYGG